MIRWEGGWPLRMTQRAPLASLCMCSHMLIYPHEQTWHETVRNPAVGSVRSLPCKSVFIWRLLHRWPESKTILILVSFRFFLFYLLITGNQRALEGDSRMLLEFLLTRFKQSPSWSVSASSLGAFLCAGIDLPLSIVIAFHLWEKSSKGS